MQEHEESEEPMAPAAGVPDPPREGATTPWRAYAGDRRLLAAAAVALAALVALALAFGYTRERASVEEPGARDEHAAYDEGEVALSEAALAAAALEIESVTTRPAVAPLTVPAVVEANQEQLQQATPLVAGRVERVFAALGDTVRAGEPLAIISSPEAAEMQGKLHEAETRLALAERNAARVKQAENRASVITARAKLDEAEATLARTQKLTRYGAVAGKDLMAAETEYRTAKAIYEYESNIALNREVQEAVAEVETARTEASHLRQSLEALGASPGARGDISIVTLRAPVSGRVIERAVNAGAGVQAGTPIFSIANLSTVWVIASVPEGQMGSLRVGSTAEVRPSAPGAAPRTGVVAYVDPILDEQTRTARVRVEVGNPGERLMVGMFVQVGFRSGVAGAVGEELVVAAAAVQRTGERTVVFVPKTDEPGAFEVRDVEVGGETEGYRRVLAGLALGERVVTKGSFTLKTQMMKGELGEHGH